jgi:membrane-bound ClpP family serine protease
VSRNGRLGVMLLISGAIFFYGLTLSPTSYGLALIGVIGVGLAVVGLSKQIDRPDGG